MGDGPVGSGRIAAFSWSGSLGSLHPITVATEGLVRIIPRSVHYRHAPFTHTLSQRIIWMEVDRNSHRHMTMPLSTRRNQSQILFYLNYTVASIKIHNFWRIIGIFRHGAKVSAAVTWTSGLFPLLTTVCPTVINSRPYWFVVFCIYLLANWVEKTNLSWHWLMSHGSSQLSFPPLLISESQSFPPFISVFISPPPLYYWFALSSLEASPCLQWNCPTPPSVILIVISVPHYTLVYISYMVPSMFGLKAMVFHNLGTN